MWFWLSETVQQPDTRSLTIIFLTFPGRKPVWNHWLEQAVTFHLMMEHHPCESEFLSLLEKFIKNWFVPNQPLLFALYKNHISWVSLLWRDYQATSGMGEIQTKGKFPAEPGCKPIMFNVPGIWNHIGPRQEGSELHTTLLMSSYHIMKSLELVTCTAWVNVSVPVMA